LFYAHPAAAPAKPLLLHMPKPLQVKTFKSLLEGSSVHVETDYHTNTASFNTLLLLAKPLLLC
jgi:hypothetical protein